MYSLPYIFIFILLFVLSIPIVNTNKHSINIIWQYYAVFFILAVFIGFRGFIFTDWRLYYAYYQEVPLLTDGINNIVSFLTKSKYSVYEKGFSLFTIIIKTLSTDYFIYQFLSFSIDLIILFYFFKYYIPDYILLGFVFFFMFNGVIGLGIEINFLRNAKALMLFLISVKYAQEKNIIVYSILNILGIFFHISSIIYLLIYPFLNRRFNYITYIMVFLLGNIIYLLQLNYLTIVLKMCSSIFGGQLSYVIERYINNQHWNTSYGISIGYLERIFTYIFVLCFSRRLVIRYSNIIFINSVFLYVLSYLYFSEMKILTDRIPLLFAFSYWIIYPQIYSLLKKDFKYLFLFLFLLYSFLKILSGHSSILNLYDNALFLQYDYQERLRSLNSYFMGTK